MPTSKQKRDAALAVAYEAAVNAFVDANRAYSRAVHDGALTDSIELAFLRARRAMDDAYQAQFAPYVAATRKD